MRKFKRALITGICGSGGSFLAEYILENHKKTEVYGFYRKLRKRNVQNIIKKSKLIKCDMNFFKKVYNKLKHIKPDVIFHIASDLFFLYYGNSLIAMYLLLLHFYFSVIFIPFIVIYTPTKSQLNKNKIQLISKAPDTQIFILMHNNSKH